VTVPENSGPARGDAAPRIAPAPAQGNPEELQSLLDTLGRPPRPAPNLFLTLARHPVLLRDWLPLGSRLLLGSRLPPRDRELVILRTAWLCGCEYEWGHHVRIGARAGLTDDEVADVRDPSAARWSGHDAAVLRATGELVSGHTVSQATWDALARTYDDAELIEFTMLAGHYVMLAGLLNAARVARDAGTAGFPPGPGPA
jgi:4-carboxymuconolactone decarboxylase